MTSTVYSQVTQHHQGMACYTQPPHPQASRPWETQGCQEATAWLGGQQGTVLRKTTTLRSVGISSSCPENQVLEPGLHEITEFSVLSWCSSTQCDGDSRIFQAVRDVHDLCPQRMYLMGCFLSILGPTGSAKVPLLVTVGTGNPHSRGEC